MTKPVGASRLPSRSVPLALVAALGTTALGAAPAAAEVAPESAPHTPRTDAAQADAARVGTAHADNAGTDTVSPVPTLQMAPATTTAPMAQVLAAPARVQSTYRVQRGDTVSHIAVRIGSTVAAIVAANGLRADAFIREGQTLVLPGASASSTGSKASRSAAASTGSYTVRRGDTVSHIAVRNGTTTAAVIAANGLSADGFIRAGQHLTLPAGRSSSAAPAAPAKPVAKPSATSTYTVRAGDTLSHVAARTGTTLSALRAANPGLDRAATLQIGQRLAVPGRSSATPGSAPMSNTFLGRTYPEATVRSATLNRDALAARSVPSRAQMQALIADTARRYGVDPAMAQAIGYQESGFNMRAVSPANAVGAMQVIPSSGQWASEMVGRRLDLLDPEDNVTAGVLLLRAHTRTGADQATVIAAYYQGMASVKRNGLYSDTRRYVASIQTLMTRYR